jgi:hypothetical protein
MSRQFPDSDSDCYCTTVTASGSLRALSDWDSHRANLITVTLESLRLGLRVCQAERPRRRPRRQSSQACQAGRRHRARAPGTPVDATAVPVTGP